MIKAIIFDCFGVLAESGWGLIDDSLKPTDEQWEEMSAISHACDMGIIPMHDLVQGFADILGVKDEEVSKIIASQRKNLPLLRAIETLQEDYVIAMLSNVGSSFIEDYFSSAEKGLFSEMMLSSDIGITKPNPAIYHYAATKLGLRPEECLFIDDSSVNVVAAEAEGMKGLIYTDMGGLRSGLADLDIELSG